MNYVHEVTAGFPNLNLEYWIFHTVAMLLTALIIPRLRITSIFGAVLTVFALVVVNSTVWNAALFFELPNSMTTRTVLLLLSNGVIFWLLVKILPGIEVDGFLPAVAAPIIFTLLTVAIDSRGPGPALAGGIAFVSETAATLTSKFQGGSLRKLTEPNYSSNGQR